MLKVLLLANNAEAKTIAQKLQGVEHKIIASIAPNVFDENNLQQYNADLIITNSEAITNLLDERCKEHLEPRQQVKAVTHKGIRLVPINDVYIFKPNINTLMRFTRMASC